MSIGARRKEVENAIMEILQEGVPEVSWTKLFKGFQREKGISGSLVCDHIDFEYDAKNQLVATANYSVIITDPNNLDTVDAIADTVFELLDDDDLNGSVTIGEVKSINYAAAPNKSDAGAAILIYEVNYYV